MTRQAIRTLCRSKRGFTLVEALVAITIIAVLLSLLLPAVQSSRESARRTECRSHLHQIGIASQNYELVYRVFPGSPQLGAGQWQVQLLPFLEQPSDAQIVPVYGCPSDEFGRGTLGQFSYHVNDGLWQIDANGFARADLGRPVRAADITDGLSNTAAFAEKLAWPDIGGMEYPPEALPEYRIRRIRNTADFISNMDAFADECRDNALLPPREWEVIWGYNHILTPNQNSCYNGPRTRPEHTDYWAITATSQHAGGVHALHADGSVRFVAEHVDRWAWRAVGSRNRGEVVAVDW